jgi:hypothetical protein
MEEGKNPLYFSFWVSSRRRAVGTIVSLVVMAIVYITAILFGVVSAVERRADRAEAALEHSRAKFTLFERFAPNMDFYWSFALKRAQGSEAAFGKDLRVKLVEYDDSNHEAMARFKIEGIGPSLEAPNLEGIEVELPLRKGGLAVVCSRERDLIVAFEEFTFESVRLGLAIRLPRLAPERFEESPVIRGRGCR